MSGYRTSKTHQDYAFTLRTISYLCARGVGVRGMFALIYSEVKPVKVPMPCVIPTFVKDVCSCLFAPSVLSGLMDHGASSTTNVCLQHLVLDSSIHIDHSQSRRSSGN